MLRCNIKNTSHFEALLQCFFEEVVVLYRLLEYFTRKHSRGTFKKFRTKHENEFLSILF